MKSFEEFLGEREDIPARYRPYYIGRIRMYCSFQEGRYDPPGGTPAGPVPPYRSRPAAGHPGFSSDPGRGEYIDTARRGPASAADGAAFRPDAPRGMPHVRREPPSTQDTIRFLAFLEKGYEPWKVKQARHALQLYSYYLQSCRMPAKKQPCPEGAEDWRAVEKIIVRLMRLQHYALRTEKSYLSWIHRFASYVGSKEPRSVTETDLKSFLSHLAVERKVAAATQKLAFNALLFLFRNVLAVEIRGLENVVPSHVPRRLPVVLTMEEVKKVFACMGGTTRLMAVLIYGSGLRLQECLSLRIKDVDFGRACLTVRGGKGDKDRQTVLPQHNTLLGVPKIEAALCVSAFRKESASSRLLGDNTQT
jgi:hypothetical protein